MASLLDALIKQVESLGEIELQISAKGVYPGKRSTKVQDVAVYQNDGTKTIKASHFVQRAESRARAWKIPLQKAVGKWLGGNEKAMNAAGARIAKDINKRVDRIKTRRLMHSFRHVIKR